MPRSSRGSKRAGRRCPLASAGLFDDRAFAGLEVERDAERRQRKQEVGEQDGRVHAEGLDGLQGDLHGELRRAAEREQGVLRAQGPVLRHVAPGLRMNQTGVRSTCWSRQARRKRSLTPGS
jgi:hypothetical protein